MNEEDEAQEESEESSTQEIEVISEDASLPVTGGGMEVTAELDEGDSLRATMWGSFSMELPDEIQPLLVSEIGDAIVFQFPREEDLNDSYGELWENRAGAYRAAAEWMQSRFGESAVHLVGQLLYGAMMQEEEDDDELLAMMLEVITEQEITIGRPLTDEEVSERSDQVKEIMEED